jgi:hypothetical protein
MPFVNENQKTIEKTPNYFSSMVAAKRIHDFNPRIKLIVMIRDPIIRSISHFTHDLKYRWNQELVKTLIEFNSTSALFEALTLDEFGDLKIPTHYYINYSLYVENFKFWLQYFDKEQFLFVDGESFSSNPYKELKKVEKFLNLKPFIEQNHFIFNSHKGFYCLNNYQNRSVKCMNENKGRKHPFIQSSTIEKLRKFYKPFSLELFKILNLEPFWRI